MDLPEATDNSNDDMVSPQSEMIGSTDTAKYTPMPEPEDENALT